MMEMRMKVMMRVRIMEVLMMLWTAWVMRMRMEGCRLGVRRLRHRLRQILRRRQYLTSKHRHPRLRPRQKIQMDWLDQSPLTPFQAMHRLGQRKRTQRHSGSKRREKLVRRRGSGNGSGSGWRDLRTEVGV